MPINSYGIPDRGPRSGNQQLRTPRDVRDLLTTPKEVENEPSFLKSRKNKAGIGAAAAVIGIHAVIGLGFLWPVVAAASYGAAALLTPLRKQRELPTPTPQDQVADLNTILNAQLVLVSGNTSPAVHNQFVSLASELEWLLNHWDRFDERPSAQASITTIIKQHIPDALDAYFAVIDRNKPERIGELNSTVRVLEEEAKRIRQAVEEDSVTALRDRTLAVKLQYGAMPVVEDANRYDGEP